MRRSAKVTRRLDELDARLHGPFLPAARRTKVLALVGRRGLDAAVTDGRIVAVLPGVYVAADLAKDHRILCAAIGVWSKGRVLITGESALHLFNERFPAPRRIRGVAPPEWGTKAPAWIELSRRPPPPSRYSGSGITCVAPEIALLDAWARAPRERRKAVLYRALWLRIVSPKRLITAGKARARLPDRRTFDAIMAEFIAGAESPTEVMAKREVFHDKEFAKLEWHVEMIVAGRKRTLDARHVRARIVIECDGEGYHSGRDAVARDRERDAEFAAAGWQTVRFSFHDLAARPEWCREILRATIATRLASR